MSDDEVSSPDVWSDIISAYDESLTHYPEDHVARGKHASLAYACRHDPEAHEPFGILGDNLTSWREFPFDPLAAPKARRDAVVKAVSVSNAW